MPVGSLAAPGQPRAEATLWCNHPPVLVRGTPPYDGKIAFDQIVDREYKTLAELPSGLFLELDPTNKILTCTRSGLYTIQLWFGGSLAACAGAGNLSINSPDAMDNVKQFYTPGDAAASQYSDSHTISRLLRMVPGDETYVGYVVTAQATLAVAPGKPFVSGADLYVARIG